MGKIRAIFLDFMICFEGKEFYDGSEGRETLVSGAFLAGRKRRV